jgi:uncharacterized membrane-anchored protein
MLRRTLAFIAFVALVAAVSALVYFNPAESSFRYSPERQINLPLGVLMLVAAVAGMLVMFVLMLLREGRHAVHEWRIQRGIRTAERTATLRGEARSLSLAGDYPRARALFTKATKIRNPDVGDLIDYAGTYVLEGNAKEAKRVLENAQKDFGNDPLLLSELARASHLAGDDSAAVSALERALAVYPRSTKLLTSLRDALVATGSWGRAAEIQERLVELRPDDVAERNRLAGVRYEAALRMPREERAAALAAIVARNEDFVPAVVERARTLVEAGDPSRAAKMLEKAVRRRPHGALLDAIERFSASDDTARVAKLYAKLVESFPDSTLLRARAVRYLTACGRSEQAAELLRGQPSDDAAPAIDAARVVMFDARGQATEATQACKRLTDHGWSALVPWRCDGCAARLAEWSARCPTCQAWGSLDNL